VIQRPNITQKIFILGSLILLLTLGGHVAFNSIRLYELRENTLRELKIADSSSPISKVVLPELIEFTNAISSIEDVFGKRYYYKAVMYRGGDIIYVRGVDLGTSENIKVSINDSDIKIKQFELEAMENLEAYYLLKEFDIAVTSKREDLRLIINGSAIPINYITKQKVGTQPFIDK